MSVTSPTDPPRQNSSSKSEIISLPIPDSSYIAGRYIRWQPVDYLKTRHGEIMLDGRVYEVQQSCFQRWASWWHHLFTSNDNHYIDVTKAYAEVPISFRKAAPSDEQEQPVATQEMSVDYILSQFVLNEISANPAEYQTEKAAIHAYIKAHPHQPLTRAFLSKCLLKIVGRNENPLKDLATLCAPEQKVEVFFHMTDLLREATLAELGSRSEESIQNVLRGQRVLLDLCREIEKIGEPEFLENFYLSPLQDYRTKLCIAQAYSYRSATELEYLREAVGALIDKERVLRKRGNSAEARHLREQIIELCSEALQTHGIHSWNQELKGPQEITSQLFILKYSLRTYQLLNKLYKV